jgi:hypothetical protein
LDRPLNPIDPVALFRYVPVREREFEHPAAAATRPAVVQGGSWVLTPQDDFQTPLPKPAVGFLFLDKSRAA